MINFATMNKKVSQTVKYTFSFVLAGVLVYFAFRGVDWTAFLDGLKQTRWGYVLLFFVVALLAVVFREERWRAMLMPLDGSVRRIDAWDTANVGNLTNVVLPGAGEFIRCAYISRGKRLRYDESLGTVICERTWDVVAVALLFAIALAIGWNKFGTFFTENILHPLADRVPFSALWLLLALLLAAAVFLLTIFRLQERSRFCGRIAASVRGLGAGFVSFAKLQRKWLFLTYTAGIWLMYLLMSYCILKALPPLSGLSLADALFISAVSNIASVIPVPGGIGAYHYLVALCLSTLYGATWDNGILFATLAHEGHALLIIVLGVVSYLRLTLQNGKHKRASRQR